MLELRNGSILIPLLGDRRETPPFVRRLEEQPRLPSLTHFRRQMAAKPLERWRHELRLDTVRLPPDARRVRELAIIPVLGHETDSVVSDQP